MTYFRSVLEVGDLYLDKILFEFDKNPMIFVCKDQKEDYYLCLCTDVIIEYTWMITKVSRENLLKLLLDEIPILDIYKSSLEPIIIAKQQKNVILYEEKYFDEIAEEDLPEENEKLENPYISDYIEKLKSELIMEHKHMMQYDNVITMELNGENKNFVKRMQAYCYYMKVLCDENKKSAFTTKKTDFYSWKNTLVCYIKLTSEGEIKYMDLKPDHMGDYQNTRKKISRLNYHYISEE